MERLTLTWARPDGEEAVSVELTYSTPAEASDVMAELLDLFDLCAANARLINEAPEMYRRLIKLSVQTGRFPEIGDGKEQWRPADVARALLREIEGP